MGDTVEGAKQDVVLSKLEFLSREEVLRRRLRRVKQLARFYKGCYWDFMEEVKGKYKEYYWLYGKSPFKEDEKKSNQGTENDGQKLGSGSQLKCQIFYCKDKAMALTRYCHKHILHDSKQMLYRGCNFPIKSAQICKKPVLRSINPPYCPVHAQAAEKYLTRALKRAGLNVSSTGKLSPKLHVVVAEFVHQIQSKRRAAQRKTIPSIKIEEKTSES